MFCVGHDQVLGMATLGAEAPAKREDLHEGQHPVAVDHQLRDEAVTEDHAVFCWTILTQPG